jgi:Protein of unknown function (DUF3224)
MPTLKATFQIDNWDENEILEADGGSKVTRALVTRSFDGDVDGEGSVEWLMAYDDSGKATFLGLERVEATIDGKTGSFVLQHVGKFDGQTADAELLVVPGTGTGDLSGLSGEGTFEAGMGPDGERNLNLEYELK